MISVWVNRAVTPECWSGWHAAALNAVVKRSNDAEFPSKSPILVESMA